MTAGRCCWRSARFFASLADLDGAGSGDTRLTSTSNEGLRPNPRRRPRPARRAGQSPPGGAHSTTPLRTGGEAPYRSLPFACVDLSPPAAGAVLLSGPQVSDSMHGPGMVESGWPVLDAVLFCPNRLAPGRAASTVAAPAGYNARGPACKKAASPRPRVAPLEAPDAPVPFHFPRPGAPLVPHTEVPPSRGRYKPGAASP
jgi:hypothetical protein